jgi:hypothetical protein
MPSGFCFMGGVIMAEKKKSRISEEKKREMAINNWARANKDVIDSLMKNPKKLEAVEKMMKGG